MLKTTFRDASELPAVLQSKHLADFLGLSRSGAYQLLSREGFPTLRIGKRIVTPKSAFLRWLDENTIGGVK